jgi:chemotaxis protein histidine kinase CheA/ActR/RegA family two-component response regulator
MELAAFVAELHAELDRALPDLEAWRLAAADTLGTPEAALEAADGYLSQMERFGEACEMIGLAGVTAWCEALRPLIAALGNPDGTTRASSGEWLAVWPPLLADYLRTPADFDASAALVAYLTDPACPCAMAEDASLELAMLLTTPPALPEDLAAEAQFQPIELRPEDASIALPADADLEVFAAMMAEAPDSAAQFARLMSLFAAGQATDEDLRNAKRVAHSFKGSANILGIRGLAKLGHHSEDLIEIIERDPGSVPESMRQTLRDAARCVEEVVGFLSGEDDAPGDVFAVLSRLADCVNHAGSGAPLEEFVPAEVPALAVEAIEAPLPLVAAQGGSPEGEASLRVPVRTMEEMFRLAAELSTRAGQLQERLRTATLHAKSLTLQNMALRQHLYDLDRIVDLRGISMMRAGEDDAGFDPLELDQYNELHGATRTLNEVSVDILDLGRTLTDDLALLGNELLQQERLRKDIQDLALRARMTPLSSLVPRLTRNVRQTAQQTGKLAEVSVTGSEILVDGDVLGALADPLLHILRNAVDHGIESREEREALGKPAMGTIDVRFEKVGSYVVVTIRDDGRGLDYEAIRAKAVDRGLLAADAQADRAELARLVFMPGFSTRSEVTEVSGRGIGMDVVLTRIRSLKGDVELTSEPGEGCVLRMRFQPSAATQHVLLVRSAGQAFAVPSVTIEQAIAPGVAELVDAEGVPELKLRDELLPVVDLATLMGAENAAADVDALSSRPILVVRVELGRIAVAVDAVSTARELVVKGLGHYLRGTRGVSGASILGDGSVVLVIDIEALARDPASTPWYAAGDGAVVEAPKVLIVDDSLSVRKALTQLVRDAGYEVLAVHDGLEAIRALPSFAAQVVLTDLEMPNMNGLELTAHLRAAPETRELPIVMITSRSMDKHRDQAERAGVSHYLVKPYNDLELLQAIHLAVTRNAVEELAAA